MRRNAKASSPVRSNARVSPIPHPSAVCWICLVKAAPAPAPGTCRCQVPSVLCIKKSPGAGTGMRSSPAAHFLLAPQPSESFQEEASHSTSHCLLPLLASPPGPRDLTRPTCRRASGSEWSIYNKARVIQGSRERSSKRKR